MAWKPDYCTLAELKAHLRITDTDDDGELAFAISSASRAIDYETDRQFGSASQVRYYTNDQCLFLDGRPAVAIHDVQTTSGLAVAYDGGEDYSWSESTVQDEDWSLWPFNAASDGIPWTHLVGLQNATYLFPYSPRGVRVTATFGWTAVPAVVKSACLIQAARFFVRRDSAFGESGSPELGSEVRLLARLDPDVALMLTSVKRRWSAV